MTTGELFESAWRFAIWPWEIAAHVGQDSLEAGERAGRSLTKSAERRLERLLDDVIGAVIGDAVMDRVLTRLDERAVVQQVVQHMLDSGAAEQIAERVLAGPELPRMLRSAFRSELPDELVAEMLTSEAVWILVAEIAASPSVTEAITHQGVGFAEQVGAKARDRSRHADTRLQELVQRIGRRREPADPGHTPGVTPASRPTGGEQAR